MDVPAFKIGGSLQGILRPDKLILYVRGEESVWSVARELSVVLRGCEARGVAFSAPIEDEGLLSWGMDPSAHSSVGFAGGCSWRTFIAQRIAAAMSRAALVEDLSDQLIEFALARLRLEGIEPNGWRPASDW